jgi:hypothetical protein
MSGELQKERESWSHIKDAATIERLLDADKRGFFQRFIRHYTLNYAIRMPGSGRQSLGSDRSSWERLYKRGHEVIDY